MTTHLVIPDGHAKPGEDLSRFDLLNKFIKSLRPEVIINLGDAGDMHSLNSFDKGFDGTSYEADIDCTIESFDRTLHNIKYKPKRKVFLVGNHEHRITRTVEQSPELAGDKHGVSMKHLQLDKYFSDVVDYEGAAPGTIMLDGINYAHYSTHVDGAGRRLHGLVAGSFKGKKNDAYAGTSARNYWRGVVVKRMVSNGSYDLQMVSMAQLEETYNK